MDIHNHLPGGFENGGWSQSLPESDIEAAVHLFDAAVALHDERWGCFKTRCLPAPIVAARGCGLKPCQTGL